MTVLARARSNCKRQTRPLVRERAPRQQTRNCLTLIKKIWSLSPRRVLYTKTDWHDSELRTPLWTYLPHFEQKEVGLREHHAVCVSVYPPSTCEQMNQSLWNLVLHTTPPELFSTAYFINPYHQCVCVSVCVSLLPLQGNGSVIVSLLSLLGNGSVMFRRKPIQATINELLDSWFYMRSVSYERVCGSVCPLSLLGNISVKTFRRQRRIVGGVVFQGVRVISKQSRR
jgi:hypothetical protein